MKRRTGTEVRQLVLSAAEDILQEEGIDALSIRDLAARTGYSPSALYKHFDSKDEVLAELKETFLRTVLEEMQEAVGTYTDPAKCLAAELRAFVDQGRRQPNHYLQAFCTPAPALTKEAAGTEAWGVLEDTIRRGIDQGRFAPVDVNEAAFSVWASIHGLMTILACYPSKWEDPEAAIDRHIGFIIAGLRA